VLVLAGCGGSGGGSTAPPAQTAVVKVLFLGNSYTAVHDLPQLFDDLAASAGRPVQVDRHAPGGNTLGAPQATGQPHMSDPTSLALIASDAWDFVVLQEESTLPTIPLAKDQLTKPGAQSLAAAVAANDPQTTVVLFQTWGRALGGQFCSFGDCSPTFADFSAMQDSLTAGYDEVSALIGAPVAPVGEAWRTAMTADPTVVLHESDGSHPNLLGSYLAACVFYAELFDESPVGLSYDAGLPPAAAAFLQQAAWDTVRNVPVVAAGTPPLPIVLVAPSLPLPILIPAGPLRLEDPR